MQWTVSRTDGRDNEHTVPQTVVNYDNGRFLFQRSLPLYKQVLQNLHRRIGSWGTPSTVRLLSMTWFSPRKFPYDFTCVSRRTTAESHCQRATQQRK